jgi:pseudomonalisin
MSLPFVAFWQRRAFSFLLLLFALPALSPHLSARAQANDRITGFIDDEQRIVLRGNVHPMAIARYDKGAVAADFPMEHMLLTLLPDPSQQDALNQLVEAQQNPESALYHKWLTPEQYGERFGVSAGDVAQIAGWLQEHGMVVDEVTPGRRAMIFSGTAAQVSAAFHTQIHAYKIGEELHHANVKDPEIPAALVRVVGGVASLHDFHSRPTHRSGRKVSPDLTSGGAYYLAPADFATIYDLAPLYQESISGGGQAVAIVARSNINLADVREFRTTFGLPTNDPQIVVNGTDPGIWNSDEETEADLDVEWSGAVATSATIKFVVSKSTNTTDGVDLSAQYIVSNNMAPVMSTSFGLCEQWLGASGNSFLNSLWQQAAAQGITVFVSSGDSGAAGCDSSSAATATNGLGVNGLCSTPYSVCVGGNEFNDTANPSLYWSASNASGTQASAITYIPEVVWNESGSSGLWASGGGASTIYAKPSWQTGTGVPADGKRDVPDVSVTAAGHDGYLIVQEGGLYVVGGTSAASPSFAGIMALVVQNASARQGNASNVLYPLATKQAAGGAAVFHDITSGNNSVPGQAGFSATPGYDQATGLGSVDASVLVNHWSDGTIAPAFQAAASASSISVVPGSNNSVNLNATVSGGFSAAVAFSITGLPRGVTAVFTPTTLPAPGSGSSTLKLTAASGAAPGIYAATVSATSGSTTHQVALSVTVAAAPAFVLSGASSIAVAAGSFNSVTFTSTPNSTFNNAVSFSVTGLPSGVTAAFTPATLPAPGSGSSVLKLTAKGSAAPGSYSASVSAGGGTITKLLPLTVTIAPAPAFALAAGENSVNVPPGGSNSVSFTTTTDSGFNAQVTLTVSGLPTGVTTRFSPSNEVTAPGSGTVSVAFLAAPTTAPKAHSVIVSASGGSITRELTLTLNIPGFSLASSASSVLVSSSAKGTLKLTLAALGGFDSAVALSVSGLPTGITASFSPATVAVPGNGSSTLTLTKGVGATAGASHFTVMASGVSFTQSASIALTVK